MPESGHRLLLPKSHAEYVEKDGAHEVEGYAAGCGHADNGEPRRSTKICCWVRHGKGRVSTGESKSSFLSKEN